MVLSVAGEGAPRSSRAGSSRSLRLVAPKKGEGRGRPTPAEPQTPGGPAGSESRRSKVFTFTV